MKTFISPYACARAAYEAGLDSIGSATFKRGRQTVGIALHYNGDAQNLLDTTSNAVPLTATYRYAPEIKRKAILFLTAAEVKRRKLAELTK